MSTVAVCNSITLMLLVLLFLKWVRIVRNQPPATRRLNRDYDLGEFRSSPRLTSPRLSPASKDGCSTENYVHLSTGP
jgi:hypothetical protein